MCLASLVHVGDRVLAPLVEGLFYILNECIAFIDQLPGALITGLFISHLENFLLYGLLLSLLAFFARRRSAIRSAMVFGIAAMVSMGIRGWQSRSQAMWVVYHVPDHHAMSIVSGRTAMVRADTGLLADPNKMRFNVEPHLLALGVRRPKVEASDTASSQLLPFGPRGVLVLDRIPAKSDSTKKVGVGFLLLTGAPNVSMEFLQSQFSFERLVFDTSNPRWLTARWSKVCDSLGVPYHDVNTQGAFVARLR
jgi:competence protein ComEC